jgi:TonB family protein
MRRVEADVRYRYAIAIVGALSLCAGPAHGQLIGGEVNDEKTGVPLGAFSVFLHRLTGDSSVVIDSIKTDPKGFFQFVVRDTGTYQLAFGFQSEMLARGPKETIATDTAVVARRYLVPLTRLGEERAFYEFQVEKPALAISGRGSPKYPADLKSANIEGRVVASFVVDTSGRAERATFRALQSTHPGFTQAVREALPQMRFVPATVAGIRVRMHVQQAFEFRLDWAPPQRPPPR